MSAHRVTNAEIAVALAEKKDISHLKAIIGDKPTEGMVTADVGAVAQMTDGGAGTSFYVKESGAGSNTGWAAKQPTMTNKSEPLKPR